jgi:trehalose 6-phosphate phosphatase
VRSPQRIEALAAEAPLTAPPLLGANAALFLDFDGTLVDIAPRPDHVVVAHGLPATLEALAGRLGGAVAIITGRWLADVDGLLAPAELAGAGLHGAELRDGRRVQVRAVGGIGEIARALRQRFGADRRVLVEDKGAAVALHFRLAPERATECTQALRAAAAKWPDLDIVDGKMVIEARAHDSNKGAALRKLAAEAPFRSRVPVFAGDDTTDEDGFAAAGALGGYGVKVGDGPTCARYRLAGVADVHAWLRANVECGMRSAE